MSLGELAVPERVTGSNSVLRKLQRGEIAKVFLSKEADAAHLKEIVEEASRLGVPIEWAEDSLQLGRACAVQRRTAAAALLKK